MRDEWCTCLLAPRGDDPHFMCSYCETKAEQQTDREEVEAMFGEWDESMEALCYG